MDEGGPDSNSLRWCMLNPEAIARIVEEALRDDAWWIAARNGCYVQGPTVWADCIRPRVIIPAYLRADEDLDELLRRTGRSS